MTYRGDFLIVGADGSTLAVVEVKNRENLSASLATSIRRNLVAHGLLPVRYFLLLSQDRGYLWKTPRARQGGPARPTAEFPMQEVFSDYLDLADRRDERLRGVQLELLVEKWLDDLTHGIRGRFPQTESALAKAGLLDDLRGASVVAEALV